MHADLSALPQAYTMDKLKNHLRRDPKYRGHVQAMDAVEAGDYKSAMKYGMYVGGCHRRRRRVDHVPARTAHHLVIRARHAHFQASKTRQTS